MFTNGWVEAFFAGHRRGHAHQEDQEGLNGGLSPEVLNTKLFVTCARRKYCLVIQLIHDDDRERWSNIIVVDVQFYDDDIAALSGVVLMCHVWCWCAPFFVAHNDSV